MASDILLFQIFYAYLAMATLSSIQLPGPFHDTNQNITLANSLAYHCLSLFLQDCKDLVSGSVRSSIATQLNSPLPIIVAHGETRKLALSAWLKSQSPLAWSDRDSVQAGAYYQLIIILNEDPDVPNFELQKSRETYSHMDMAKKIYQMIHKPNLPKISAPIYAKGSFYHALPLAMARMKSLVSAFKGDKDNAIVAILARMMKKRNIHFVPWHKCGTGVARTTRAYVVQGDWWLVLSNSPLPDLNQHLPMEPQQVHAAVAVQVIQNEPNAPWVLPEKLKDMGVLWNKTSLPTDWSCEAASLPASVAGDPNHYIRATYEYVQDHYDGTIWWHHMALVWAILFSKVLPYTFAPRNGNLGPGNPTDEVRSLPWLPGTSENRGGSSAPLPFITMTSAQIIALLDDQSPLNIYVKAHKQSLGGPWTKKHGNKGIHAINMVRIGVATCERGIMGAAKYQRNWRMKPLAELRPLYEKVIQYLKYTEFGEYLAMRELFGEVVAIRAASKKEMDMPGFVSNEQRRSIL